MLPTSLPSNSIQPGSLKTITDSKLATFAVGQQKKSRFQKAKEEAEAKKQKEVEEAAKIYDQVNFGKIKSLFIKSIILVKVDPIKSCSLLLALVSTIPLVANSFSKAEMDQFINHRFAFIFIYIYNFIKHR